MRTLLILALLSSPMYAQSTTLVASNRASEVDVEIDNLPKHCRKPDEGYETNPSKSVTCSLQQYAPGATGYSHGNGRADISSSQNLVQWRQHVRVTLPNMVAFSKSKVACGGRVKVGGTQPGKVWRVESEVIFNLPAIPNGVKYEAYVGAQTGAYNTLRANWKTDHWEITGTTVKPGLVGHDPVNKVYPKHTKVENATWSFWDKVNDGKEYPMDLVFNWNEDKWILETITPNFVKADGNTRIRRKGIDQAP